MTQAPIQAIEDLGKVLRSGGVAPAHSVAFRDALTRIASDSGQVRRLHEILGTYCHQCRNLLNTLGISLYLVNREPAGEGVDFRSIEAASKEVEQFFDRLQAVCRPLPHEPVKLPLGLLFQGREEAWSRILGAYGRALILEAPLDDAPGDFDPTRLQIALDDLIAWRASLGAPMTALHVGWRTVDGWFRVSCAEVPDEFVAAEADGEPGSFPDLPPIFPATLAVLTMPLLTRTLTVHGGRVMGSQDEPWRLEFGWPLAGPDRSAS